MRYMLDTNIINALIKNPFGKVANHIRQLEPHMVCTSIIVVGALQYGAIKKASANLNERANNILQIMPVLLFNPQHAEIYGKNTCRTRQKRLAYWYE